MSQIYLIGTNHRDLKGRERLLKALELLRPRFIVEECSRDYATRALELYFHWSSLSYSDLKREVAKPLCINPEEITSDGLDAFLRTYKYEITVPFVYATKFGAQIACPLFSPQEELQMMREATAKTGVIGMTQQAQNTDNLWIELLKASPSQLEAHQKVVEDTYQYDSSTADQRDYWDMAFGEEEKLMEESVRKFLPHLIAVVTGFTHLFSDRRDLYRRLEDLLPRRFRLSDFDRPVLIY